MDIYLFHWKIKIVSFFICHKLESFLFQVLYLLQSLVKFMVFGILIRNLGSFPGKICLLQLLILPKMDTKCLIHWLSLLKGWILPSLKLQISSKISFKVIKYLVLSFPISDIVLKQMKIYYLKEIIYV